ncbi:MAG: flagellin, partial [Rhodopirellula sp. JB053]
TLTNIKSKIDALTDITSAIVDDAGDPLTGFDDLTESATDLPAEATGTAIKAGLKDTLVFQLNGADGAETFNFGAGTSLAQIKAAVNLVSDSTGVVADDTGGLSFRSNAYGSDALVNIEIISEGTDGAFETSLSATRQTGQDIQATINGVEASARGNTFSINTSTLDLNLTVDAGSSTDFTFSITGGGALFQLGPDVTTNQQARLGIGSVSTGQLGGVSGRLYELGSGQAKSLTNDVNGAAKIIDEVINKVTSLRGRLGAFQATSLESNLVSLNETLANLEEAESSIRDADFAQESANLTRAQILVQSGTNVLSLANQNPQNVLSLLG